ncbi:MAG: hypothetical protein LBU60_01135 [Clostridiales bacterium]|nr:hypothetical protein [Clostridiales bacterium]
MEYKNKKRNLWPLKAFVLAFVLTVVFSLLSEVVLTDANLIFSIIVLVIFLLVALLCDLIGVAVTACDKVPFLSMASRKIKGAKCSLWLINNQSKVASFFGDIIGDISAIITGAIGVGIAFSLAQNTDWNSLAITIIISSLLAAFTVGCKALVKLYAIKHSHSIVKIVGRIFLMFGLGK